MSDATFTGVTVLAAVVIALVLWVLWDRPDVGG